jgi:hypothetical protein
MNRSDEPSLSPRYSCYYEFSMIRKIDVHANATEVCGRSYKSMAIKHVLFRSIMMH